MTGSVILPVLVILIATAVVYITWHKLSHKSGWTEKAVLLCCYVLVLAICLRYSNLVQSLGMGNDGRRFAENFEVNIPDPQEIIDEESEKSAGANAANKSLSSSNREPQHSGPVQFNEYEQIHKFAGNSNNGAENNSDIDLPGLTPKVADMFSDIKQSDTSGTNSIFKPQIVLNGVDLEVVRPTAKGSDYVAGPAKSSPFNNLSASNLKQSTISEYLQPSDELFGNTGNSQGGSGANGNSDAYSWMETFLRQNVNTQGNQTNAACDYNKPYAEERGRANQVDSMTLSNKSFVPGMSYLPPSEWRAPVYDMRQCRTVCPGSNPNTRQLPIGIMDHGTPIFALEIGSDGTIAKTEAEVRLTNVGSIMPKFVYREYIDCLESGYMGGPATASVTTTTNPSTTI